VRVARLKQLPSHERLALVRHRSAGEQALGEQASSWREPQ
jgi:hypothetical protein